MKSYSLRVWAFLIMLASAPGAYPRILVHGHRGARAIMPENTLPAFEYAIGVGVDVLELDLAVTKDNVLVASHDPHMNPAFCRGPEGPTAIRQMTLAQLKKWDCGAVANPAYPKQKAVPGTRVPALDEVLALAPRGTFEFNIETKIFRDRPELTPSPEEFARLLVEAIRRHKLEKRVMIQSFDFRTLEAAARMAPDIRRSALFERAPASGEPVSLTSKIPASILSPHFHMVTAELVQRARQAKLTVVPWTANTPTQWDPLIAAGVDAIISDDPAALIDYLKKKGVR